MARKKRLQCFFWLTCTLVSARIVPALSFGDGPPAREVIATGVIGSGGLLSVDGHVNGRPIEYLIDTGSAYHVFGNDARALLTGLATPTRFPAFEAYPKQKISIGTLFEVTPQSVVAHDLSDYSAASGHSIQAIIAPAFFIRHRLTLEIDPMRNAIEVSRNASSNAQGIGLQLDEDILPYAHVMIAGESVLALLDTGSNGDISLDADQFASLLNHSDVRGRASSKWSVSANGTERTLCVQGVTVEIGGMSVADVEVTKSSHCKLGMGILTRFYTKIDFGNRHMTLQPIGDGH